MLDVVYEIEVIRMQSIISRFDNEQIDRTSIHDKMSLKWFKFEQLGDNKSYSLDCSDNNISSVVEFQRWWVLKSKIFSQESTKIKNSYQECQFIKNWA